MAVDIIFSEEQGGDSITPYLDLGIGGFDLDDPDPVNIWIRHTGEQSITNVRFYVAAFTSAYIGESDPQTDFDDIVDGDSFGYLEYAIGEDSDTWFTLDSTRGSSLATAVSLDDIAAGNIGIVIRFRFNFLSEIENVDLGVRQIGLKVVYTYTI